MPWRRMPPAPLCVVDELVAKSKKYESRLAAMLRAVPVIAYASRGTPLSACNKPYSLEAIPTNTRPPCPRSSR